MQVFEGRTADEVWYSAARLFAKDGTLRPQNSRDGPTLEIPQGSFVISEPQQRWVFCRVPPANIAFAIVDLVWLLRGRDDSEFLTRWSKKYSQYAGEAEHLHGSYGYRLRKRLHFDQLERAFCVLRNNSESRQVVLQIWDATCDLPLKDGSPVSRDVPCNAVAMLKIREGKLEWTQVVRSNDLYRGVVFNFVQFTSLQEILSGWLGVLPGQYTHFSDSLHVYDRDLQFVSKSRALFPAPENNDNLLFDMQDCEGGFEELEARIEQLNMASSETSVRQLLDSALPRPLQNFLAVLAAERARRLRMPDIAEESIAGCTNPYLVAAWSRWAEYLGSVRALS